MENRLDDFRLFLLATGYQTKTIHACIRFVTTYLAHDKITKETVTKYLAECREQGLATTTINRYLAHLKMYARWLKDDELLSIRFFREEMNFAKRIFTDDEIDRFLRIPRHKFQPKSTYDNHQLFWTLIFYTGCRPSEIASARVSDFDLDHWEINVHHTKTFMSRKVPIAVGIRDYVAKSISSKQLNDFVCPLTPSAWNKAFVRRCKKAGIQKVHGLSTYSARHTVATNLVKTSGVIQAKRILGHRKLATTEQYVHLDTQALHDAINSMTFTKQKLSPREKIDIFLRDVVNVFFWDDSEFEIEVKKNKDELKLKVRPR